MTSTDPWEEPRYYRLLSDTQDEATARKIVESGELWGRVPRFGVLPAVNAYVGELGDRPGIEFTTVVPPDPTSAPGRADWRGPRPGVITWTDEEGVDWAKVTGVRVTKVNAKDLT